MDSQDAEGWRPKRDPLKRNDSMSIQDRLGLILKTEQNQFLQSCVVYLSKIISTNDGLLLPED